VTAPGADRAREIMAATASWHAAGVLPDPWDLRVLCARVGEWRGRPLHLVAAGDYGWPGHLLLIGDHVDMIVHDDRVAGLYERHGVLHELGHLALGHDGVRLAVGAPDVRDVLAAVAARARYDDVEEREAETFATLMGIALDDSGLRSGNAVEWTAHTV
jgi:hypothetical protein